MKIHNIDLIRVFVILLVLTAATANAQTTAINYQGKLTDTGTPQGTYQMSFALYDALVGGNQIGESFTSPTVAVDQGIFSVQLDFGAVIFTGADRFLQISVRRNASETYTVLSPREKIASSPYSIRTLSSAQADVALDANKLGGINASEYVTTTTGGNSFIKNSTTLQAAANFNISGNGFVGGNFGIGTAAPTSKLQILTGGYGFTQTDGNAIVGSYIGIPNTPQSTLGGWFGTKTNHPLYFFAGDSNPLMTLALDGNVGIGIVNPTIAKLQVLSPVSGISAVYGESSSGRGLWGKSSTSRGVYGESVSSQGVFGVSNSSMGVFGSSTSGSGVYGETAAASLSAAGLFGKGTGSGSIGVIGESNLGDATGVFGVSTSPTGFGMYARNNFGGRAIFAEGNVAQDISSNGLVKAMLTTSDGVIVRCYNGITNSSAGNCGFNITLPLNGVFRIDFGFPVASRFVSVTAQYCNGCFSGTNNTGANYRAFNNTSIEVFTFQSGSSNTISRNFTLILY